MPSLSKRPASVLDGADENGEARRKSRVGYKDVNKLAAALGPHVRERFFTTYTTDRSLKQIEKKKLCGQPIVLTGTLSIVVSV